MASLINSAGATGTGSMTIQGPNTNSNQVLTIPDATGTVMVSGNMPAFYAYSSNAQTLSAATNNKILFDTKLFDTNTNYATATSRFTPTVAGYYQINSCLWATTFQSSEFNIIIYKNGSFYSFGSSAQTGIKTALVSSLVYCNGSTDYIEIYSYTSSGLTLNSNSYQCYFNGSLVRSA